MEFHRERLGPGKGIVSLHWSVAGRKGGGKEGTRGTQIRQRGLTAGFHYLENQKVFREKYFKVHLQFTSCLYN